MLFRALSCLLGRPPDHAWDALAALAPDGLQLTPGNLPGPGDDVCIGPAAPNALAPLCTPGSADRPWLDSTSPMPARIVQGIP